MASRTKDSTIQPEHTFAVDGVEIRSSVLDSEEILTIQREVSIDHEILRRTGIRNLEKKLER